MRAYSYRKTGVAISTYTKSGTNQKVFTATKTIHRTKHSIRLQQDSKVPLILRHNQAVVNNKSRCTQTIAKGTQKISLNPIDIKD